MNYHKIDKFNLVNGEGVRVVLWLSGCEHGCKGCHNPQTWNIKSGQPFGIEAKDEIYEELSKDYVHGITLSGGDPLHTANREELLDLLMDIKQDFPNKTVWCYTGYTYEEVQDLEHLKYIDVLVDGKYVEELNTPKPQGCGSSNQRILRLK